MNSVRILQLKDAHVRKMQVMELGFTNPSILLKETSNENVLKNNISIRNGIKAGIIEFKSNNNEMQNNCTSIVELSSLDSQTLISKIKSNEKLKIQEKYHPDFYQLSGVVEQGIVGIENDASRDFFAFLQAFLQDHHTI